MDPINSKLQSALWLFVAIFIKYNLHKLVIMETRVLIQFWTLKSVMKLMTALLINLQLVLTDTE